jgi:hypothetical protein
VTPAGRFPRPRSTTELRGPIQADSPPYEWMQIPAGEKRCGRCGGSLPLDAFALDRSKPSGRGSYCRPCTRAKSAEFYAANRERILARAAAKRGPQPVRHCSECGVELEGGQRVTCGSARCREARFKRLRPESYARREAAKVDRRRERRRSATKA